MYSCMHSFAALAKASCPTWACIGRSVLLMQVLVCMHAGLKQRKAMAAVFSELPVKVLWKLTKGEVPDAAALAELNIGDNTKVNYL